MLTGGIFGVSMTRIVHDKNAKTLAKMTGRQWVNRTELLI